MRAGEWQIPNFLGLNPKKIGTESRGVDSRWVYAEKPLGDPVFCDGALPFQKQVCSSDVEIELLAGGDFVEPFHPFGGVRYSMDENSVAARYPGPSNRLLFGFALLESREVRFDSAGSGLAEIVDWAEQTLRIALQAYGSSEFHHGLIVVARAILIHESLSKLPIGLGCLYGRFELALISN